VTAFKSAARAVSHVAQCVEFFRGSRVETYQPLFELTTKLATPALLTSARTVLHQSSGTLPLGKDAHTPSAAGSEAEEAADEPDAEVIEEVEQFVAPSLSQQALRLLLAIVSGHEQVWGIQVLKP